MKNRRDAELVQFFRDAGVPAEQIVYLQDRAATTANIEQSLKRLLSRTRPDDMLVLFGARLTPNRQKCCLLGWRVLQTAIYSPVETADSGPCGDSPSA